MRRQAKVDRWLVATADTVNVATPAASRPPLDPGLEAIDELERLIVLAHEQKTWSGVSAEEIARCRPGVEQLARAVCDRLRREYVERSGQR